LSSGKSNLVSEKSCHFALEIIAAGRQMQREKEFVLSKQLFRAGTGIGANVAKWPDSKIW